MYFNGFTLYFDDNSNANVDMDNVIQLLESKGAIVTKSEGKRSIVIKENGKCIEKLIDCTMVNINWQVT